MLVLPAEQRICVSRPRLWEAGSLPAEDAERVPPSHCNAAPKPPWWLHIAVWCPVYPSVKGQTLPGAGAELDMDKTRPCLQQTVTGLLWDVVLERVVNFYLASNAGRVPCRRERAVLGHIHVLMLYQQHWHHAQCVSLGVFLISSLGQYFVGNRY